MKIEVIGGGSIGLLLAAKLGPLSRLKISVRTEEQSRRIRDEGIGYLPMERNPQTVRVDDSVFGQQVGLTDREGFAADWILLTVKQKDITPELCKKLAVRMGRSTRLLCFQNGLGHAERLSQSVPKERIWLAVTTEAARRESQAVVRHTGVGYTILGKAFPDTTFAGDTSAIEELSALLDAAGLSNEVRPNIFTSVWEKLIINAVINPLTAVLRVPNGMLLEHPMRLGLMKELYQESALVAEAYGYRLPDNFWERIVKVCQATSANRSSMLQDVEMGRETEIAWINGAILEKAREKSLKLPVTESIVRIMQAIDPWKKSDEHGDASLV